jgi:hypothetical protein
MTRLGYTLPLGLLYKDPGNFLAKIVTPKTCDILGHFVYSKAFFLRFQHDKQFYYIMTFSGYLKGSKVVCCRCFGLPNQALLQNF